jgi:flagellar biosynthesis/type III secretory pathway protein FliH
MGKAFERAFVHGDWNGSGQPLSRQRKFDVIIAKIGEWSIHDAGILSPEDAGAIDDLQSFQEQLCEESRETRRRLAKALQKARLSARRNGYQRGWNDAARQVLSAFAVHLKIWVNVEKNLRLSIEKVVREALGDLPQGALLLARIEKGILAARQQPVIRIHVHPSVFPLVDGVVAKFNEQYGPSGCEVVADMRRDESECRIETEKGILEVDFERQVRALADALLLELRKSFDHDRAVSP